MPRKRRRDKEEADETSSEDEGNLIPFRRGIHQRRAPVRKQMFWFQKDIDTIGPLTTVKRAMEADTLFGFRWDITLMDAPNEVDVLLIVPEPTVVRWTLMIADQDAMLFTILPENISLFGDGNDIYQGVSSNVVAWGVLMIYPRGVAENILPPDILSEQFAKGSPIVREKGMAKTKRRIRKGQVICIHFAPEGRLEGITIRGGIEFFSHTQFV